MNLDALLLSFRLAAVVSAILLMLALPLAYWLAFTRWRGKFLLESVVALPLVLPPTVLGFYALIALGPRGPLGRLWQFLFGHTLAFTFAGLVIASLVYSLPFAVQPLIASFESLDRRLLDASSILGASRTRTFFRIVCLAGADRSLCTGIGFGTANCSSCLMIRPSPVHTISVDNLKCPALIMPDRALCSNHEVVVLAFSQMSCIVLSS